MLTSTLLLALSPAAPSAAPGGDPLAYIATDEETKEAQEQPKEVVRPPRTFLRQNEDWSSLADVDRSATGDFWDRIKYLPLDSRGSKGLSFGGHAWFRSETWRNFNFNRPSGQNYDDTFVLTRMLLHADAHFGDSLRAYVEGKTAQSTDRNLPGGTRNVDVDKIALQQGFVDWTIGSGSSKTTLRGGRQMLQLGVQRLVSPLPWANGLRSWEGVTAFHTADDWTFTGMFTRFVPIRQDDYNKGDDGKLLYGIYGTHKSGKGGQDVYWLGVKNEDATFNGTTGDEFRQTLGGRLWGPLGAGGSTYDVEGAGQFGEIGGEDILAWMVASKLTTPLGSPQFRGKVGLDWASGDDAPGGDVGTFNQLYPLGHAFYGLLDTVARQNAIDAWTGVDWMPSSAFKLTADWHFFWLADSGDALYNAGAAEVVPGAATNDTQVGNEIDLLATWKLDRHATAILGYSYFFAGDVIANSGPDVDVQFLYFGLEYFF